MPRTVEYVEINDVRCIAETDKAICVKMPDGEQHWIPKSLINDTDGDVRVHGDEGTLSVAEWFANKEGLE